MSTTISFTRILPYNLECPICFKAQEQLPGTPFYGHTIHRDEPGETSHAFCANCLILCQNHNQCELCRVPLSAKEQQKLQHLLRRDANKIICESIIRNDVPRGINTTIDSYTGKKPLSLYERISLVWVAICHGRWTIGWDLLFYGRASVHPGRDS